MAVQPPNHAANPGHASHYHRNQVGQKKHPLQDPPMEDRALSSPDSPPFPLRYRVSWLDPKLLDNQIFFQSQVHHPNEIASQNPSTPFHAGDWHPRTRQRELKSKLKRISSFFDTIKTLWINGITDQVIEQAV